MHPVLPPLSRQRRRLLSLVLLAAMPLPAAATAPPLMLARSYRAGIDLSAYWVSEKYDGVRACWDGQALFTRGGEAIHAPAWFTRGWPHQAMDGELWAGPGRFEQALSTVRRQLPEEGRWRQIRFMVFDLPQAAGDFEQRLSRLRQLVAALDQSWVIPVAQRKLASESALQQLLAEVEAKGGEGLMLHRADAPYRAGRSDDLLKLKSREDAEATVVGYLPGRGKYAGMTGALVVETPTRLRFAIGSGLSDAQRRQPPAIGSVVSYRYSGLHPSGKPRFAVLWRLRMD